MLLVCESLTSILSSLFFTASSHVNFGRPLPLLVFSIRCIIPIRTGTSGGLYWNLEIPKLSQAVLDELFFNRCHPKSITYIIVSNSVAYCMSTDLPQHTHLYYIYLLDMLYFSSPTFCTIQHRMSNHRIVELVFELMWDFSVT